MANDLPRIVLLDDDPSDLRDMYRALSSVYRVTEIPLGATAHPVIVSQIAELDPLPIAILLDVFRDRATTTSGDKTYAALLGAISGRFQGRIPVIGMTGKVQRTDVDIVVEWYRYGVSDWVWKSQLKTVDIISDVQQAVKFSTEARDRLLIGPRVFLVHAGGGVEEKAVLEGMCTFVRACGAEPVTAESSPSGGASVNTHVLNTMRSCDLGLILATWDREVKGKKVPRGNISHEFGLCQSVFGSRIVVLAEEGCTLPSNVNEFVRARFRPDHLEEAYISLVANLRLWFRL